MTGIRVRISREVFSSLITYAPSVWAQEYFAHFCLISEQQILNDGVRRTASTAYYFIYDHPSSPINFLPRSVSNSAAFSLATTPFLSPSSVSSCLIQRSPTLGARPSCQASNWLHTKDRLMSTSGRKEQYTTARAPDLSNIAVGSLRSILFNMAGLQSAGSFL